MELRQFLQQYAVADVDFENTSPHGEDARVFDEVDARNLGPGEFELLAFGLPAPAARGKHPAENIGQALRRSFDSLRVGHGQFASGMTRYR